MARSFSFCITGFPSSARHCALRINTSLNCPLNHGFLFSTGACFHRSKWDFTDWTLQPNTFLWWTLSQWMTNVTGTRSTVPNGWWRAKQTPVYPGEYTFIPTLPVLDSNGWNKSFLLTNLNSQTTWWTTMGMYVVNHNLIKRNKLEETNIFYQSFTFYAVLKGGNLMVANTVAS